MNTLDLERKHKGRNGRRIKKLV